MCVGGEGVKERGAWFRFRPLVFIKFHGFAGWGGGGKGGGASPANPALLLHCQILFF